MSGLDGSCTKLGSHGGDVTSSPSQSPVNNIYQHTAMTRSCHTRSNANGSIDVQMVVERNQMGRPAGGSYANPQWEKRDLRSEEPQQQQQWDRCARRERYSIKLSHLRSPS